MSLVYRQIMALTKQADKPTPVCKNNVIIWALIGIFVRMCENVDLLV